MNNDLNNCIYTDVELVRLSLDDQKYFGLLVDRYEKKLRRYIQRITHVTLEDQEDMLQNIFLKVYVNLNGFKKDLSFNSWVYRIAHNEIIDWSRKHRTQIKNGKYDYDDEILSWTEDLDHFLVALDIKENAESVQKILSRIDVKYREVLVLKFLEGYSYREISDILKKPEGTIATLINRAKKAFKQQYE